MKDKHARREERKKKKTALTEKENRDEPPEFVTCPECGEEQPDMGHGVSCESCGYGPMDTYN